MVINLSIVYYTTPFLVRADFDLGFVLLFIKPENLARRSRANGGASHTPTWSRGKESLGSNSADISRIVGQAGGEKYEGRPARKSCSVIPTDETGEIKLLFTPDRT